MNIEINLQDTYYLSYELQDLIEKIFSKDKIYCKYLKLDVESYIDLDCSCGETHIEIYGKLNKRFCSFDDIAEINNVKLSFSIDSTVKKDCNNLICMFEVAKHFKEIMTLSVNNVKHTKRHGKKYRIIKDDKYEIENLDDENVDSVSIRQSSPSIEFNKEKFK